MKGIDSFKMSHVQGCKGEIITNSSSSNERDNALSTAVMEPAAAAVD